MVAARLAARDPAPRPALAPESEDTPPSRYATPVDQESARYDHGSHSIEVIDPHEAFGPSKGPRRFSKAQRRELAIKQAALRIAAGMESRSFRIIARQIGCSHQAIDKALIMVCERIGIRKFLLPDWRRKKLSDARQRHLAKKSAQTQ